MDADAGGRAARWIPAPLVEVDFDAVLAEIRANWVAVGLIPPPRPVEQPRHLRVVRGRASEDSEAA